MTQKEILEKEIADLKWDVNYHQEKINKAETVIAALENQLKQFEPKELISGTMDALNDLSIR